MISPKIVDISSVYKELLCEWDSGSRETSFRSWLEQNYGLIRDPLRPGLKHDPLKPEMAYSSSFLYEVIGPSKYTLFLLKYSNATSDTQ